MPNLTYSQAGINLTKTFEGLLLKAYRDCRGILTIGWGHVGPEVHEGQVITLQEARQLLLADMTAAVRVVNTHVKCSITQSQFDAMVDFAYNAGIGAFATSTLLERVNAGDLEAAANEFGRWVHAGGQVVDGLVRRREAEAKMFRGEA